MDCTRDQVAFQHSTAPSVNPIATVSLTKVADPADVVLPLALAHDALHEPLPLPRVEIPAV